MRVFLSAIVFGLVAIAGSFPVFAAGGRKAAEKYDVAIMYPGPHTPEQLYYRNPNGPVWLQWTTGDFTRKVTCPGALKRLKRTGVWKGHLKPDGACGPTAEPSDWAVGNWINYYLCCSGEYKR